MESSGEEHSHQTVVRQLPDEVGVRRKEWWSHFKFWRRFYFSVGTLGAAVSAIAAINVFDSSPYLAAVASICFAILGFTHPERNYLQYVRAWRILDVACKRYQYEHQFTMERLLDAVEQGERLISEFEYTPEGRQETKSPPTDKPSA
ncbi:MAG: hypothetical protein M0Q44_12460 [Methylobacter sp.]|jgi:hypothetical protein|nr:hypothetical protein [Methylobacter sp.]